MKDQTRFKHQPDKMHNSLMKATKLFLTGELYLLVETHQDNTVFILGQVTHAKKFTVCRPLKNFLDIALQTHVSWLPEFFSILDTKIELNVSIVLKQWKIGLRVTIFFHHTGTAWIVSSFAAQITLTYLSVPRLRTKGHKILPPC